jgi:asparaginyl-tRNA synthetase
MSLIYVDETGGSDTTGTGSLEEPYQSLAQAIYAHGQESRFRIRKTADTEYEEPTPTSLKKAKKNAQGIEKKRRKEEEQAELAAGEKERRQNLLEESKTIVLQEAALPIATRVSDTPILFSWYH